LASVLLQGEYGSGASLDACGESSAVRRMSDRESGDFLWTTSTSRKMAGAPPSGWRVFRGVVNCFVLKKDDGTVPDSFNKTICRW
jgi:hypothetical protein